MKRRTMTGVNDVAASFCWYQTLFGQPESAPVHDCFFGQLVDADGTVLLCLRAWGEDEHPSLMGPEHGAPGNGLLFIRVDDFDLTPTRARKLVATLVEEPHLNPNTRTVEVAVRDLDGYYVMISAL